MRIGDVWVTSAMLPELCALAGVHRTTAARWLERRALPPAVYRLLRILQTGDLGEISDAWSGWRLSPRNGELYAPNDDRRGYGPGHVLAMGWRAHQLAALERSAARDTVTQTTEPGMQSRDLRVVSR